VQFRPTLLITFLILVFFLPSLDGQVPSQRTAPADSVSPQRPEEEARAKMEKDMEKRRNEERQKQIKRDTEKLLQLATELKEYVDKSNENILSMDVVKKADEIERYAHSVKEKMKTAQ
jgi:nitric oxide reductase activation protein